MAPVSLLGVGGPLLAQGTAGAEPVRGWDILRHDVIPVAAAFVVFLGLLVAYRRATRSPRGGTGRSSAGDRSGLGRGEAGAAPGWGELLRYVAGMAAGGYLFFLAIVLVFYFVLGGEDRSFIRQALVEGSLLAFGLVVPAFLLFSRIEDLRSRGKNEGEEPRRRRGARRSGRPRRFRPKGPRPPSDRRP
ncbi:MAG: DUF6256 family protein [Actinomycetota bacterium]